MLVRQQLCVLGCEGDVQCWAAWACVGDVASDDNAHPTPCVGDVASDNAHHTPCVVDVVSAPCLADDAHDRKRRKWQTYGKC